MITDHQFLGFLQTLAEDQRGKNPLLLTEWENRFLDSFTRAARPSLWFTPGRREAAEKMWRKLGPELNFPHPDDLVQGPKSKIQNADPDGCEYLVRDEEDRGVQHRCNAPATCREPGRLRYCDPHAIAVKRYFPNLPLVPLGHE